MKLEYVMHDVDMQFPSPRGDEGLNTRRKIFFGRECRACFRPLAGMKDLTLQRNPEHDRDHSGGHVSVPSRG